MKFVEKELYYPAQDNTYATPFIDCKEMKTREVNGGEVIEYLYIHGGFEGTGVKFMFCFPKKEQYEGRFFQHLSPFPGPDEEIAAIHKTGEEDVIAFSLTHGSAYVESNMGSTAIFGHNEDSRIIIKSSSAVAEYARVVAKELFGEHRVYGYIFGGSGGGYKTMSCLENSASFDGALPFVIGSPVSLPNCLTCFVQGKRMLRNCWEKIVEALEPGGDGDIYNGLTEEESAALSELICLGYPPRMVSALCGDDDGALPVLLPGIKMLDPGFFTDFWNVEGYDGANKDSSACRDRIYLRTKVKKAGIIVNDENIMAHDDRNGTDTAWQKMLTDAKGAYLDVEKVPTGDLFLHGVDIIFESGEAKGKKLHLSSIEGERLILGASYGVDNYQELIGLIKEGDQILLDNSDYVAAQYYHRHQIPEDPSFHAFDQYKDENGTPIYPQRPVISYGFTAGGCGSVQDGKVQGKVIIMNNLMDGDFPWQADWYYKKIEEVYGTERVQDIARVYYNDNAPHGDANEAGDMTRVVSYLGMLQQGLLELKDWVEKGEKAPENTGYELIDNQIILRDEPNVRGGLQPVFDLKVNGKKTATIKAGESIHFTAVMQAVESAGRYESIEWCFEGDGNFAEDGGVVEITENKGIQKATITKYHTFETPGRYYAVARVCANQNLGDIYTRLRNLDRVRVDVV